MTTRRNTKRRKSRRKTTGHRKTSRWEPVKHPGSLERYGYTLEEGSTTRHRALSRALKAYGYKETVRKVGFLAGAARISPTLKEKAREDLIWLESHSRRGHR